MDRNSKGNVKGRTNYCVFCQSPNKKIIRHLERTHAEEKEVRKFKKLKPGSALRRRITTKLRLQGNHLHNHAVMETGEGTLLVMRALKDKSKSAEDYYPCISCKGWYMKEELRRHTCPHLSHSDRGPIRRRGSLKEGKQMKINFSLNCSAEVAAFYGPMRDDDILKAVKFDPVANELLDLELQKGEGDKPRWLKQYRYKWRLLGRFITEARKLVPGAHSLTELLQCNNFIALAKAANECGKGPQDKDPSRKGEALSVPLKVGFLLKGCAEVMRGQALREKNEDMMQSTKNLLELYDSQWSKR